jgi:hypothetical protein
MEKPRRIIVIRASAVTLWVLLVSLALVGCITTNWANKNLTNKNMTTSIPIWQITQPGTDKSITWVDYEPNPRFAIYDAGVQGDPNDDLVLDKETGLAWQRSPDATSTVWAIALGMCEALTLGNRMGWRGPTWEELASLLDPSQTNPSLPPGHPFINVTVTPLDTYWTITETAVSPSTIVRVANFRDASFGGGQGKATNARIWCVRGGQGLINPSGP